MIQELIENLKKDPQLFEAYKCNIAMAFKDEVSRLMKSKRDSGKMPYFSRIDSHNCANKAAEVFLNSLISQ